MDLGNIQSIIISGILLGSLYSIMAPGLSLVYGTLRMYNFTHGSLIMMGAYLAWSIAQALAPGLNFIVVIALTLVLAFALGAIIEKLLINPFLNKPEPELLAVITTLAGAIFLNNAAHIIWGPRFRQIPLFFTGEMKLLGLNVSRQEVMIIVVAPLIIGLLWYFLKNTRIGFAIRAVEQNRDSATLIGINIAGVYMITFAISACLAALAGIFLGSIRFINPTMGDVPLLKSFIVVILGGLGNIRGTMMAAYIVGFIEAASMFFLGIYWTPALLFLLMIIGMTIKPTGLFGEA